MNLESSQFFLLISIPETNFYTIVFLPIVAIVLDSCCWANVFYLIM